jgi:hypothetical protein
MVYNPSDYTPNFFNQIHGKRGIITAYSEAGSYSEAGILFTGFQPLVLK